LSTNLPRPNVWHPGHKSGVILSLSLITVALNSTSTFLPRPLYHNCGLVLGLILLALASVGFSCLGLRPVTKEGGRGGTAHARSKCPSSLFFYLKLFYSSDIVFFISVTPWRREWMLPSSWSNRDYKCKCNSDRLHN